MVTSAPAPTSAPEPQPNPEPRHDAVDPEKRGEPAPEPVKTEHPKQ